MWYPLFYIMKARNYNATCSKTASRESFHRFCTDYEIYFDETLNIDFSLDIMKSYIIIS